MGKIIDAGNYRFPVYCIDNFWNCPDDVVSLANSLPFTQSHSSYPGIRTKELGDIASDFNTVAINKIVSLFFDLKKIDHISLNTKHYFQKISKFSNEKNINIGMVHQDSQDYEHTHGDMLSCIIYLNKNPNLDAGTSLFEEKNINSNYSWYNSELDLQDKLFHNNQFTETIRFQNIYNRLVAFDSRYPHAANFFDGGSEDRLTEVFFIKSISLEDKLPINRIKNFNE